MTRARLRKKTSKNNQLFGEEFKTLSIILSGIAVTLLFLVPQITGLKIAEVSSYYMEDAHCIEKTSLTKLHCFGDFGYPIEIVRSGKSIWNKEFANPYPVINFQLFLVFSFLAAKISYLFSLILYLFTLILSIAIPFLHALKDKPIKIILLYISTCILATLPFLIVIDRGNNNVWVLPFIYFFIAARYKKIPQKYDVIFAALAMTFRPQYIILVLIFVSRREYKKIFTTIFLSLSLNFIGLILWDVGNFLNNIKDQINQIIRYGSGIPGIWPPSLSFSRGMKTITETLNLSLSDSILLNLGYIIGVIIIIKLVLLKNVYSDVQVLFLTLPLVFLLPAISWYYYSALLLVIVAITLLLNTSIEEIGINSKARGYLFLCSTVVTTSPICLPIWQGQNNVVQVFVPIIWIITYIVFLFTWRNKIEYK